MTSKINIGWLKDDNGEKFAPKTLLSQVITSDGTAIETKIENDLASLDSSKSDKNHNHDDIYETKEDAKIKYDTFKEFGTLIDKNTDAIDTLETVATSKANASDLTSHTSNKSNPHNVTASQLGLSTETWTFTLNDGTAVTKKVVVM